MNQEITLEIVKLLGAVILGGGLNWLFNYKTTKREASNGVAVKEFESVDEIVENFTNRMTILSNKLSDLMKRNLEIEERLARLQQENRDLLLENQKLQEELIQLKKRWEK